MGSDHDNTCGNPAAVPPPDGLGKAGCRLWRSLIDRFEFAAHELIMVEAAARQADMIARLETAVDRDGICVAGSAGQARVHPAVAEVREGRLALSRLLSGLHVSTEYPAETEKRTPAAAGRGVETGWPRPRPSHPSADRPEWADRRQGRRPEAPQL